jgi:hypothetical protein
MITTAEPASTPAPDAVRTAVQDVLKRTPKRQASSSSTVTAIATATADPRAAAERARLTAAVVLDVLAGNRSPGDAATALGLSVARYYVIEAQAIDGLIAGCGPRQRGRQPEPGKELARLTAENQRLTQALLRQQALVRTGQRSLGVVLPAKPAATATPSPGRGKGRRQPKVRALRAAKRLNAATSTAPPPVTTSDRDCAGG